MLPVTVPYVSPSWRGGGRNHDPWQAASCSPFTLTCCRPPTPRPSPWQPRIGFTSWSPSPPRHGPGWMSPHVPLTRCTGYASQVGWRDNAGRRCGVVACTPPGAPRPLGPTCATPPTPTPVPITHTRRLSYNWTWPLWRPPPHDKPPPPVTHCAGLPISRRIVSVITRTKYLVSMMDSDEKCPELRHTHLPARRPLPDCCWWLRLLSWRFLLKLLGYSTGY